MFALALRRNYVAATGALVVAMFLIRYEHVTIAIMVLEPVYGHVFEFLRHCKRYGYRVSVVTAVAVLVVGGVEYFVLFFGPLYADAFERMRGRNSEVTETDYAI
jgi:hypothetical protein